MFYLNNYLKKKIKKKDINIKKFKIKILFNNKPFLIKI